MYVPLWCILIIDKISHAKSSTWKLVLSLRFLLEPASLKEEYMGRKLLPILSQVDSSDWIAQQEFGDPRRCVFLMEGKWCFPG